MAGAMALPCPLSTNAVWQGQWLCLARWGYELSLILDKFRFP